MIKKINRFTYLLCAAGLLAGACSDKKGAPTQLHSVYVAQVGGADASATRSFPGMVVEDHTVSLGFKTPGQIKRIYVKEGQAVRAGQLLAELDNADYRLGVEALQIQYDQVKEEVARARRLYEKNSMSANDYEKAAAGLRQLAVQLQVNKNKLDYTRLTAPASGIVGSVNFAPAEMVDAGTAVFTLINSSSMEVECDIPASVYAMRDRLSDFTCTATVDSGRAFPLRLLSVLPKADGNQLYRMRLAFVGKAPHQITSGMNVEVTASTDAEGQQLTIPSTALFRYEGKECVWLLMPDSTVMRRAVNVTGAPSGSMVTVAQGLSSADRVVTAGVSALREGERVKVIAKPSETNVGGLL